MVTVVYVQLATFACMNLSSFNCDKTIVDVVLKCLVQNRDEKLLFFIAFYHEFEDKINQVDCEHEANQLLLSSCTYGQHVGICSYLT